MTDDNRPSHSIFLSTCASHSWKSMNGILGQLRRERGSCVKETDSIDLRILFQDIEPNAGGKKWLSTFTFGDMEKLMAHTWASVFALPVLFYAHCVPFTKQLWTNSKTDTRNSLVGDGIGEPDLLESAGVGWAHTGILRDQKRTSDPLELELQAGYWGQSSILWESIKGS